MEPVYPQPQEVGIKIPTHLIEERFCSGFKHALQGGQLTHIRHLRQSFREGYRAAKMYIRVLRRQQGIIEFPMKAQFHARVYGF